MIVQELDYVSLQELATYYVEHNERNITAVDILEVEDEHGNKSSTNLDITIKTSYEGEANE